MTENENPKVLSRPPRKPRHAGRKDDIKAAQPAPQSGQPVDYLSVDAPKQPDADLSDVVF